MRIKNAFTIVELLAVVGIILVIMSLMVPTVSKAMEKSNIAAAKATLEKLEMAVRNYQAAYGQWPQDLSYQYLGKKLPSYNFGSVLPLLQYEKDSLSNPAPASPTQAQLDAQVYQDPWGHAYCYYWIGQNPVPFQSDYNALVASGGYLDSTNHLSDVIDPPTLPVNAATKLIPGFLLWSPGPDTASGGASTGADDIGNWGKTRSKMVSGVS